MVIPTRARAETADAVAAATELLESESCSSFMRVVDTEFSMIFEDHSEKMIQNFLCNAIERAELLQVMEGIEYRVAHGVGNECLLAWEAILLENLGDSLSSLDTFGACKEIVSSEIAALEGHRRALLTDGKHRELFFPLVIVIFIPFAAIAVAGIVGSIANADGEKADCTGMSETLCF